MRGEIVAVCVCQMQVCVWQQQQQRASRFAGVGSVNGVQRKQVGFILLQGERCGGTAERA